MSDWFDDKFMSKLRIELGRVRAEVDVQKHVVLFRRDVVEPWQGLHGVGRTDLFQKSL